MISLTSILSLLQTFRTFSSDKDPITFPRDKYLEIELSGRSVFNARDRLLIFFIRIEAIIALRSLTLSFTKLLFVFINCFVTSFVIFIGILYYNSFLSAIDNTFFNKLPHFLKVNITGRKGLCCIYLFY